MRPATKEDGTTIALVVLEAVGMPVMENGNTLPEWFNMDICLRDDTLYSYSNTTIFEIDGIPVGALVAYRGENYRQMRDLTFNQIRDRLSFNPDTMDEEAQSGEYYLDSIAVFPEFRGKGIGKQIIQHGINQGVSQSLTPVLACSPENINAHNLYTSLGFKDHRHIFIFGEDYIKMKCE